VHDVGKELAVHVLVLDGPLAEQAGKVVDPLPADRKPARDCAVPAIRGDVVWELEDLGRTEPRGDELAVRCDDAMLRPGERGIAGQRAEIVDLAVRAFGDAVELDVVARHAVVRVSPAVPLMRIPVLHRYAALLLQV